MYRRKPSRLGNVIAAVGFFTVANFVFWNLTDSADRPDVGSEFSLSAGDATRLLSSLGLQNSEITVKIEHGGQLKFVETARE